MKTNLVAPKGYKYLDIRTGRKYSRVVVIDKDVKFFELVPSYSNN